MKNRGETRGDEFPFRDRNIRLQAALVDPMDVDSHEGKPCPFVPTTAAEYTFYVMPRRQWRGCLYNDLSDCEESQDELCYSGAYEGLIEEQITAIDTGVKR